MRKKLKNQIQIFCNLIRQRSKENGKAIAAITRYPDIIGPVVALLRQELDSMIRVIYLLSIHDFDERERLIRLMLNGEKWSTKTKGGTVRKITDREMVELAQDLQGWTKSVYKFGCAFIHLSDSHNYLLDDPFQKLPDGEKADILKHMRYYHGGPCSDSPGLKEITHYLPMIFEKISSNLECYLKELEKRKIIDNKTA